jgi:hypothetical protein
LENRPKLDLDTIKKHMEECRIEEGSSNASNLISETVGKKNLTLCHSLWQPHHRKQKRRQNSRTPPSDDVEGPAAPMVANPA